MNVSPGLPNVTEPRQRKYGWSKNGQTRLFANRYGLSPPTGCAGPLQCDSDNADDNARHLGLIGSAAGIERLLR
jgi:hypothetical protein